MLTSGTKRAVSDPRPTRAKKMRCYDEIRNDSNKEPVTRTPRRPTSRAVRSGPTTALVRQLPQALYRVYPERVHDKITDEVMRIEESQSMTMEPHRAEIQSTSVEGYIREVKLLFVRHVRTHGRNSPYLAPRLRAQALVYSLPDHLGPWWKELRGDLLVAHRDLMEASTYNPAKSSFPKIAQKLICYERDYYDRPNYQSSSQLRS